MARGRDKFKKNKNIIIFFVKMLNFLPRTWREKLFSIFQNKKGITGLGARYILLKTLAKNCGENVSIHPGVYIFHPENLDIGDNVSIHPYCYLDAEGGILIGNDVSIAHGTSILSNSHNYKSEQFPIKDQGMEVRTTTIKNNVWIGAKVTILFGVIINSGVIIGANAVVTKNAEENCIFVGVPARKIKKDFSDLKGDTQ